MPEGSTETRNLPELCARAAVMESLTIERYARLLAHPTWSWLLQALDHTRSYERGLEVGFLLLSAHERFEVALLGRRERAEPRQHLRPRAAQARPLGGVRPSVRSASRAHAPAPGRLRRASRAGHLENGAGPSILADVPGGLTVHFLHGLRCRREVVRRKIDRRSRGARLGNLRHARQSDLTEEELRKRVERVVRPGHDPDGAGRV